MNDDSNSAPDPEEDRPWTEEQWLAMFRKSDARSARFGELLETLRDDPQRDEIIAREMGWEHRAERLKEGSGTDDESDDPDFDLFDEPISAESAADDEEDESAADDHSLDRLLHDDDEEDQAEGGPLLSEAPAFQVAIALCEFTLSIEEFRREIGDGIPTDADEALSELLGNSLIPAAKIRGGHSFGYDDDICANIVNNRFALEAVEKAIMALADVERLHALSIDVVSEFRRRLTSLRDLIDERIAEMRIRVWW